MYKKVHKKILDVNWLPGDNLEEGRAIAEFSLSTGTFPTHRQYTTWQAQEARMKIKYSQIYKSFLMTGRKFKTKGSKTSSSG